jgi:catechol 2,3-dioxygenase-like lactoylglutathione lyase family enzyme
MAVHCDHVHLRSADAVEAARFYIDLLDAKETGRVGEAPVTRVMLDLGGMTIFVEQASPSANKPAAPPNLGIEHIGLRVDDIEAVVAKLSARGISLVSGITDVRPGLRVAFFDGPDHVRIELLQRA